MILPALSMRTTLTCLQLRGTSLVARHILNISKMIGVIQPTSIYSQKYIRKKNIFPCSTFPFRTYLAQEDQVRNKGEILIPWSTDFEHLFRLSVSELLFLKNYVFVMSCFRISLRGKSKLRFWIWSISDLCFLLSSTLSTLCLCPNWLILLDSVRGIYSDCIDFQSSVLGLVEDDEAKFYLP